MISSFTQPFLSFSWDLSSSTHTPPQIHSTPLSQFSEMFLDQGRFIFAFFFCSITSLSIPPSPHSPALLHFVQTGIQAGWQLPGNRLHAHWLRLCLCFSAWLLHGVNCRYVGGYSYLGLGAGVWLLSRRSAWSHYSIFEPFASLDEVESPLVALKQKTTGGPFNIDCC